MKLSVISTASVWLFLGLGCLIPGMSNRAIAQETPDRLAPKVAVMDLGLASVSMTGAKVLLVLQVENPNKEAITVDVIYYKLQLNELEPLHGRVVQRETFPAQQTRTVRVPVDLPYGSYLPAILALLQAPQDAEYKINGKVKLKDELKLIEFEHQGKLDTLGERKPPASQAPAT